MKLPKMCKGALQVIAKVETRRGLSDETMPVGSVGYVIGHRKDNKTYLICWEAKINQPSSHPVDDVEPTGKRG